MLLKTSQGSIKAAFEYIGKLPFTKRLLHKVSELARGKCIAFFSLHRVIEENKNAVSHPHFLNKTAITKNQARKLLMQISQTLSFVSLRESFQFLKGEKKLSESHAVLLIEVPYLQTILLLEPLLQELMIPATIVLDTKSIHDGRMPWMDEIIFCFGTTTKKEISVNFIDRSLPLLTAFEKMFAANHFIDHLSHSNKNSFLHRLKALREAFIEVALPPMSERICTIQQLENLSLNPLFSFISAGSMRMPFYDLTLDEQRREIIEAKQELSLMFKNSFLPVFFYPFYPDSYRHQGFAQVMSQAGFEAAISRINGLCRPGDNMFHLMSLPFMQGVKNFERFELQGLSDAIDEFLLVTLAQEKEL